MDFEKLPIEWIKRSQKGIETLKHKMQELNKKSRLPSEEEISTHPAKKEESKQVEVSISIESLIKTALVILVAIAIVYVLIWTKNVIFMFLIALFLSVALGPSVDRMEQWKIPRPLGIILVYLIVVGVLTIVFSSLVPIIASQISELAVRSQDMIRNVLSEKNEPSSWLMIKFQPLLQEIWNDFDRTQIIKNITNSMQDIAKNLTSVAGNAIGTIFAIFNSIFNFALVMIISFFMILNKKATNEFFSSLFPKRYSDYINQKTHHIAIQIGEWVRGQTLLAISTAFMVLMIFSIAGVDYALTLALVAGIGEFIPFLGPIITFGAAFLIAINQSTALALWLIPIYALVQFVESNILVPLIIGKTTGLNPIVILFAMLCGASIGTEFGGSLGYGLIGMMLSVPIAKIISIFIEDYTGKNK